MAGIFKAYDIRGIYGDTLTEDIAHRIGRAFATFLPCRKVVVGRDMRPHSTPLFEALARGLTRQGADVVDLGVCSTPMSYYANGSLGADASVMITASHNPGEWNGFKLCRDQAIPLSGPTGIGDIERIVAEAAFAPAAAGPGRVSRHEIAEAYVRHIRSFADLARPLRVAVDYANAMGIVEGRVLDGVLDVDPLFDELDGTFPNHEANPLKAETLEALQAILRGGGYDFGVAFDGDADRAGFVDEQGEIIPMDMITALIARDMLPAEPGAAIFYDLRSSWAVKEVIEESGGRPVMSRVGHAFIKQQMREANALFAGELSGHYYFRENYFTESSSLAVLLVANMREPVRRAALGDRSSPPALLRERRDQFRGGGQGGGVPPAGGALPRRPRDAAGRLERRVRHWWFNVRASNTEALVRLNLEARTEEEMAARRDELLALIRA